VDFGGHPAIVVGVVPDPAGDELGSLGDAVVALGAGWVLCSQSEVSDRLADLAGSDSSAVPVAVCSFGTASAPTVKAAAEFGVIGALVLVNPSLDADAVELVAEWPELPVLLVVEALQNDAFRSAVDTYLASANPSSELLVGRFDEELCGSTADWLVGRLTAATSIEEIALRSSDGWELHATLRLPHSTEPVPGVVLLHSARSDRAVYSRLERLLAANGIAVLNLDWRGRGQSVSRGTLWTLSEEERAASWRDGLAGIETLAARAEVDGDRVGLLGSAQGAEIAVRAAQRDSRVKAVVVLTGYQPADPAEEAYITGGEAQFFFVTSSDHRERTEAMHRLYEAAPGARTRYLEYPGSALGYQLFDVDPGLESAITAWFAEVLAQ
jgi:dienelactone hydrolase